MTSAQANKNTFDAYVDRRLDSWGREFNINRSGFDLGYKSKNMLAVLIEHHGEMPERPTGFAPMVVPELDWQIETIVHDIHHEHPHLSAVLRAYYCGFGRQSVERLELAETLWGKKMGKRAYFTYYDVAFQRVAGTLAGLARSA